MKRGVAVAGLLAVAGLAQGCIIETSSGPPATCGPSNITFDWVITANGISRSCAQVGGDTVSIMVDDMTMIADFQCSAFAGTTDLVAPGKHTITMGLFDSAGNTLSELAATNVNVPCDSVLDLGTVEFSLTP
jgi:hypothetical protein